MTTPRNPVTPPEKTPVDENQKEETPENTGRSNATWRNRIAVSSVLVVAFLVACLYFLLATASGSQLLWSQLVRWVPGLEGTLVSGSLSSGWQLDRMRWHNPVIDVTADQLAFRWSMTSLLAGSAELDAVTAKNLRVIRRDRTTEEPAEPESSATTQAFWISTSLPIHVRQLRVDQFVYDDPVVHVALNSLQTEAQWSGHQIKLPLLETARLDVELKPQVPGGPAAKQTAAPTGPVKPGSVHSAPINTVSAPVSSQNRTANRTSDAIPTLPDVFVPFDIVLERAILTDSRYWQSGFDTGHLNIVIQARMRGDTLILGLLQVTDPTLQRSAKLAGQLNFTGHYPLVVTLDGQSAVPGLSTDQRQMQVTVKGDLAKLAVTAKVAGVEQLQLQGQLAPLDPRLPFDLKASWNRLPLPSELQELTILKGSLNAKGSLQGYTAQLQTQGQWQHYPQWTFQTRLKGDVQQVAVELLQVADAHNQVSVEGLLSWQQGVHWKGKTELTLHQIQDWLPEIPAHLQGQITQEFTLRNNHWTLSVPSMAVTGQWNHYPLALQGSVQGNDQNQWQFKQLILENGPNHVTVQGELAQQWNVQAAVDFSQLKTWMPTWKGGFTGQVTLHGPAKAPQLTAQVTAPMVHTGNVWLKNLNLHAQATLQQLLTAPNPSGALSLTVEKLFTGSGRFHDIKVDLRGSSSQHHLDFSVGGRQIQSHLAVTGGIRQGNWIGQLTQADINGLPGHWSLQKPVTLTWRQNLQQLTMTAQCWLSAPASLCLGNAQIAASQGKIPLTLDQFDLSRLETWLPDNLHWQGQMKTTGTIGWRGSKPQIDLVVSSPSGQWVANSIKTPYQNLLLKLNATERQAVADFGLSSTVLGQMNAHVVVTDPLRRKQLSGQIDLARLQLAPIAPLVESLHKTSGQLDVHGRFAGTLGAPLFYGQINLKDGEVATAPEMVHLTAMNGSLLVAGDKADLAMTMQAGKGKIRLAGKSYWPDGKLKGNLSVNGQDAEVVFAGYGSGRVNTDIQLAFDQDRADLTGQIVVPSANIDVKSLPDSGIEVSDDVHVVQIIDTAQPASQPFPFYMDLTLQLGNDVHFSAMGLKTALAGGLRFHQKPGQALMTQGEIRLVDGRFKAYGQNLVIRTGKLSFNGDVTTPYVMAEAIRDPNSMEDTSVTVGVKINAPITALSAQIFSEPDLPDTDKLSYLLRGKSSTATTNGSTEEAMAAMMLGAGLSQTNGVVSDVASNFGLKDAGFDTSGSGTDTQVNLSAYVLKDLQLQYGVGVYSAVSEVKLRYFFLPQLYFQAVSGLDQAVDLFYKFEF
jgi:translocation and assembly module TamB